jgi:RNA polymerase sigma-70 factor, ECF subfamily
MGSDDEAELLARCRRGQEDGWNELFDRHYAATVRFVFQLGHDFTHEDAEEICQESFLSAIRNLNTFQGQSQFQTWLFRIASNKARDFRERQQAAKRGSGRKPLSLNAEDSETGLTLDPPSLEATPDQVLLRAENAHLIHQSLDGLGEQCREIIELRYFADLSYEEISNSLGLNTKTVSSRLSKCLDKLESAVRALFSGEKPSILPSNS